MTELLMTERQQRERRFYEEYSRRTGPTEISFVPILGKEKRPWNPYWFVCELVMRHFNSTDQKLLDFGCGSGCYSLLFARIGYEVFGFDISSNSISEAKRVAEKYALEDRTHFAVNVAEQPAYPSEYFDVVVGIDILHHVEILPSIKECFRLLKQGGIAIFKEPIEVPIFDPLRDTGFGKWLVPKTASYERHVTEDEKKLTANDLHAIRELFPDLSIRWFRLLSRLAVFFRKGLPVLEMVDDRALKVFPFLKRFGGEIVLILKK